MKILRRIIVVLAIAVMCVAFAGCGGSSGYAKGEQFQLGEETYALEKVVRAVDKDAGSTECYGVSLLQVGNTAPIIISGFGTGTTSTQSAIDLTLSEGETTYSPSSISFEATDEVEGYGSRILFYFDIPAGTALPASGTLKKSDSEETAEIDLSGIKPEKETTTTTTTAMNITRFCTIG